MYNRTIPRDLFNEGKLLTEMGFLSLAVHDGKNRIREVFTMEHDSNPFQIVQCEASGFLSIANVHLIEKRTGERVYLFTNYNTKSRNALGFELREWNGYVFWGTDFSEEFLEMLEVLRNPPEED